MKEEIKEICTELNDGKIAVVQATEKLLVLFSVSGSTSGVFDDAIDKWHEGNSLLELHEYLRLTKAEYGVWLLYPNLIEQYYR